MLCIFGSCLEAAQESYYGPHQSHCRDFDQAQRSKLVRHTNHYNIDDLIFLWIQVLEALGRKNTPQGGELVYWTRHATKPPTEIPAR